MRQILVGGADDDPFHPGVGCRHHGPCGEGVVSLVDDLRPHLEPLRAPTAPRLPGTGPGSRARPRFRPCSHPTCRCETTRSRGRWRSRGGWRRRQPDRARCSGTPAGHRVECPGWRGRSGSERARRFPSTRWTCTGPPYSSTNSMRVPREPFGWTNATVVPRLPGRGSRSIGVAPASIIRANARGAVIHPIADVMQALAASLEEPGDG